MSVSTKYEPPAGSMTSVRLHSSCKIICWLRAILDENSSGLRMISSNGDTVMESQPPITPENASVAVRSMLTYGS